MVKTTAGEREIIREFRGVTYTAEPDRDENCGSRQCAFWDVGTDKNCHDCEDGYEITDIDGKGYVLAEGIIWRELE